MEIKLKQNPSGHVSFTLEGTISQGVELFLNEEKLGLNIDAILSQGSKGVFDVAVIPESFRVVRLVWTGGEAVVANVKAYYDCVLDKILSWDFDGCKRKRNKCDDDCDDMAIYAQSLLSSVMIAEEANDVDSILVLLGQLDELCSSCKKTKEATTKDCGCNGI